MNNSERVKGVKIPIVSSPSREDVRTNYGNRNDNMSELNFVPDSKSEMNTPLILGPNYDKNGNFVVDFGKISQDPSYNQSP